MEERVIKLLMSLLYRAGWADGRDGKDLPTLGELDKLVDEVYLRAKTESEE